MTGADVDSASLKTGPRGALETIETQLPEITPLPSEENPPRRKRKARSVAPATNGVAVVG